MSQTPAARARPLSPHLTVYRWPITMAMSIAHRATGLALYFGTLLVAWWLIAAATSPEAFATVAWVFGSWIGRLVLFGYTFILLHHLVGGIRYLVWDTGVLMEKHTASRVAWTTVGVSVALTLIVWAVAIASRWSV